ncbi:unnamed protein product, partial [Acidithrix sp. C25]
VGIALLLAGSHSQFERKAMDQIAGILRCFGHAITELCGDLRLWYMKDSPLCWDLSIDWVVSIS